MFIDWEGMSTDWAAFFYLLMSKKYILDNKHVISMKSKKTSNIAEGYKFCSPFGVNIVFLMTISKQLVDIKEMRHASQEQSFWNTEPSLCILPVFN